MATILKIKFKPNQFVAMRQQYVYSAEDKARFVNRFIHWAEKTNFHRASCRRELYEVLVRTSLGRSRFGSGRTTFAQTMETDAVYRRTILDLFVGKYDEAMDADPGAAKDITPYQYNLRDAEIALGGYIKESQFYKDAQNAAFKAIQHQDFRTIQRLIDKYELNWSSLFSIKLNGGSSRFVLLATEENDDTIAEINRLMGVLKFTDTMAQQQILPCFPPKIEIDNDN